jgi:hypothetical protein
MVIVPMGLFKTPVRWRSLDASSSAFIFGVSFSGLGDFERTLSRDLKARLNFFRARPAGGVAAIYQTRGIRRYRTRL